MHEEEGGGSVDLVAFGGDIHWSEYACVLIRVLEDYGWILAA